MRRVLLATAVVVSAVAATATTGAVAGAAGSGWSLVTTPSPSGSNAANLAGLACSGPDACTAVGEFQNSAGTVSLAERWNGTAFSIQQTPNPGPKFSILNGVSCPSANACTAVGEFATTAFNRLTLAERWDGTAWTFQPTPNPAGGHPSLLSGVSCPAANACIAVGFYQSGDQGDQDAVLAEQWNGNVWGRQSVPNPPGAFQSFLTAVSCTAVDACTAVGHYNPTTGEELPLVERWNGTAWSIESIPSPTDEGGKLLGVSCSDASTCTTVGQFLDHAAAQTFALAERWNGSAWSIQRSPRPSGAADAFLGGVSCVAASACSAVGHYINRANADVTLAQHWDGTAWTVQATPNPAGLATFLSAVACPSTTICLAVGTTFPAHGNFLPVGERFTG